MKKQTNVRYLVQLSLLAAIELVMAYTPLGYLRVFALEITFLMVPVTLGAILLGPAAGAVLGGVFALIALIVYLVSVRPAVQYISDQLDNIAEMAQIVRSGYNWITDKLNSILCSVLESLLRKL